MRSMHIAVGVFLATFAGFAFADPGTITFASVLPSLIGGLGATALGAVLGGGDSKGQQQTAAAPVAEPVTTMPNANDAATAAAKQKSIVAQMQRQGRASTILTEGNASTSDAMG